MIRKLLLGLSLLAGMLAPHPAPAQPHRDPLVRLSVIDRDTGAELPQYPGRGQHWIAGAPGHRYAIRLANGSSERVLVVLSVDGVNAVSGETAATSQAGYVLDPWETADIEGWRKSLDEVAAFVFTDLGDSYAARTGRPDNVGVIGIAVFSEMRARWAAPRRSPSLAGEASASAAPASALGTGHGVREWSPVGTTAFVRASRAPAEVRTLRYDTERRLAALGILPAWREAPRPRAFPAGFVPDPPAG